MTEPSPSTDPRPPGEETAGRLGELARLFLKLGVVAFGGPAAHIAMMEEEVVARRRWIDRRHFLDLIGATHLIPGPNSTEMTMHVGYERAGWRGLFVAGGSFILPAAALTALCAWGYVTYGSLPAVEPWLAGIKPAVVALIAGALWKLGRKAFSGWRPVVPALLTAGLVVAGAGEVPALLAGGVLGALWLRAAGHRDSGAAARCLPVLFLRPASVAAVSATVAGGGAAASVSLAKVFLFFLKVGSILYGSGYVLIAFLEGGLVRQLGWITPGQLLDAVAIGQLTPGPVLSTATFIGYLIEGLPGAAVATLGIFLPSFLFVLILNPLIPRLRESVWMSAFLDAVNASAVALMAVVTVDLGVQSLISWPAWGIGLAAAALVFLGRTSPAWLVLGAALAGRLLAPWA